MKDLPIGKHLDEIGAKDTGNVEWFVGVCTDWNDIVEI